MSPRMRIGLAALVGLGSIASVSAHHAASAIFDFDAPVEITGTLTEVRWVNPHIRISVDPADKDAFPEVWVFESQPPQWYRRVNVSRSVFESALGQQITVAGFSARDGSPFGFIRRLTFPDGTAFQMVGDRGENVE